MPDEIKPAMATSAGHIDPAVVSVTDQDEPLDGKAPATTATFFKVLIHDINWDFVDKVVVGGSTSAPNPDSPWNAFGLEAIPNGVIAKNKPLDDESPAAATASGVLVHDRAWDFVDPVLGDITARAVTQSTLFDPDDPLDDKSPAATTAFMVLVYDKDWDFVDKVAVAATARIVTLHANPATSNDYWAQDGAGTWANLSSTRYDSKMMIEGGRLRLDFPVIDGGPFDAGAAAEHVPLSLMGQAPDLAHDSRFWF